jgi:ABC-type taurine transport system substrate-binding protein
MLISLVLLQAAITIAVGGSPAATEYLPLMIAYHGERAPQPQYSVIFRHTGGEAGAAEALARGEVDLAATTFDSALRYGAFQGRPPKILFALTVAPPVALIASAQSQPPIVRLEDLIGRTIAISALGTAEAHLLTGLLARHRLSLSQVKVISRGERGVAQALERGELQAGLLPEPWLSRLLGTKRFTVLADLRQRSEASRWLGGPTVHTALFARGDRAVPPGVLHLARDLLWAVSSIQALPPEVLAVRLPAEVTGDREEFQLRATALRGVLVPDGLITEEEVKTSLTLLVGVPSLPPTVKIPRQLSELLFLDPLLQALKDLKRE